MLLTCFSACNMNKMEIVTKEQSFNVHDSIKAIGIWQVPQDKRYIHGESNGNKWTSSPSPERFVYDGTYVTVMLFTEKAWMWKTPDDLYKLKSQWRNDTLFYLPPFGNWTPMASFNGNCFEYKYEIYDSVYTWTYLKIDKSEVDIESEELLKQRKPHDYSIKPTDPYKE